LFSRHTTTYEATRGVSWAPNTQKKTCAAEPRWGNQTSQTFHLDLSGRPPGEKRRGKSKGKKGTGERKEKMK